MADKKTNRVFQDLPMSDKILLPLPLRRNTDEDLSFTKALQDIDLNFDTEANKLFDDSKRSSKKNTRSIGEELH